MPVLLTANIALPDPMALALAALRTYPVAESDAFEAACENLGCRPDLSAVLAAARGRNLLHACLRAYRPAIEQDAEASAWLEVDSVAAVVMERQRQDLVELLAAAQPFALSIALPKGLAFALDLYPDTPVLMSDVDLLVREADRDATAALLSSLGYRRGLALREGAFLRGSADTVAAVESSVPHYGELHPFSRIVRFPTLEPHRAFIAERLATSFVVSDKGIYRLGTFDTHYSLNPLSNHNPMGDRPTEAYWFQGLRELAIGPHAVGLLSDDVLAVTLPYRLYHELHCQGGTSLKPISDLLALLRLRGVDYGRLVATAAELPAVRPALHYVYRFLDEFCCADVPREVLEALSVPSDGSFYADWGDFWPALLLARPRFDVRIEVADA